MPHGGVGGCGARSCGGTARRAQGDAGSHGPGRGRRRFLEFAIRDDAVADFVRDTTDLVPPGEEWRYVGVDDTLTAILGRGRVTAPRGNDGQPLRFRSRDRRVLDAVAGWQAAAAAYAARIAEILTAAQAGAPLTAVFGGSGEFAGLAASDPGVLPPGWRLDGNLAVPRSLAGRWPVGARGARGGVAPGGPAPEPAWAAARRDRA